MDGARNNKFNHPEQDDLIPDLPHSFCTQFDPRPMSGLPYTSFSIFTANIVSNIHHIGDAGQAAWKGTQNAC
jgi:hypothetical protein